MKVVNQSIKDALKEYTTQRKGKIKVNNTYYDVYNVEYYADCYDEGGVIGNAIASQLDFDMPYIAKFDTFQYFDGVWTGEEYEYVNMGEFTVFDEKDQDEFNKHITAFDNLIKFNDSFEDTNDYPKTLYQELQNVCNQSGVTLYNNFIPNGDFIVENNQFVNGENRKTVLKQICGISGTYGIIKSNVLYLQLKNETNETITKADHTPIEWKRKTYGINQVIIGDSQIEGEYVIRQDDDDIALNGIHKLEIKDNYFAYTQEKREQLIDALFNQVKGFGYIPFETTGEWLNYLEIGDTVTIDGITTMVLRIKGKSPNSVESEYSAPALIDSSIEYSNNTDDIKNLLKRTERIADKQNQLIKDIITEQNGISEVLSQTIQDLRSIQNLFQITGGSNLIKNSQFLLTDDVWEITKEQDGYCTSLGAGYNANLIGKTTAVANIVIKNAKIETKISNISNLKIGQAYTLHFYYTLDSDTTARVKLIGRNNGKTVYDRQYATSEELKEIIVKFTATDTEYTLSFESHTEVDGALYIYDLMLNSGDVKTWEPAMSEVYSTVLKMSQLGLQVYASGSNTITLLTSMGFKIYKSNNGEIGAVVTEFTDTGIITNEIIAKKKIQNGSWIEKDVTISYAKHHIEYMESD